MKLTKSIRNIPLLELHNFCIINGLEVDVKNEEIVLLEVKNE